MAAPYQIWIRGTNTHFDSTEGTVPTDTADNAPTEIAEPSVLNGWLLVDTYALDPEFLNQNEAQVTIDKKLVKDGDGRWHFKFMTDLFAFPADWSAYKSLMYHLSRHEVFMATETYDAALHLAGECLAVECVTTVEHKHEQGGKRLVVDLQLRDEGEVI
jgi:hypothetical protein